jgi:hypothetical protein
MRILPVWPVNTLASIAVARMHAARRRLYLPAAALSALLAGCAQPPATPEPMDAPKLTTLESAYDRAKWRWVRNPDGRALLTHTEIAKCFVDPQPPLDYHDAGFTLKRSEKTIGSARYEVVSVFEKNDFWEAVYVRPGSQRPLLSVYAAGRCQEEAERILFAYEKALVGEKK